MGPDSPIERAADEVLTAAWPRERRRAVLRREASSACRVAVFLAELLALAVGLHLAIGLAVPWSLFGLMAVLAVVFTRPDERQRAHLRRDPPTRRRFGPPTGHYPPRPLR